MPLPQIASPEPVSKPAEAEQTFPDWYVRSLVINAAPEGAWKCAVRCQPYDYASGTFGPESESIRLELDELRTIAAERTAAGNPALENALGAVLGAVNEIINDPNVWAQRQNNVIEIKPSS